MVEFYIHLKN
jgi:hypothetical protein